MLDVDRSLSPLVTELLVRWKAGDKQALENVIPLVYRELREMARYHLARERPEHTLQSAALVHEAYVRLAEQRPFDAENRAHFLAIASRLMRQILVDHARSHRAAKRGADCTIELEGAAEVPQVRGKELIALDDALNSLALLDDRQGRIVEMKFFGGLSAEEIAEVMDISVSTVKREWSVAKAWLSRELKRGENGKTEGMAAG